MSVKIIYRPVKKNDSSGYLKIRIIENRQTKIKSLGIKIKGSHWLDDKQRVSKLEPNHEKINHKIEEELKALVIHDNSLQALQSNNKTILQFYNEIIKNTPNSGTRAKYNDVKKRFTRYINSVGFEDLKFNQLTTDHVQAFFLFMRTHGCATNTANYNLKSFKAIINKAIKSGVIKYYNDPFSLIELKFTPTKHKTLSKDDVYNLLKINFIDNRKKRYNSLNVDLNEFASIFLFQLFAQGMRVSDVQLLKWGNFSIIDDTIQIDYRQFKTKKPINLKLTQLGCTLLKYRLKIYDSELINRVEMIELDKERYVEDYNKFKSLYIEAKEGKDFNQSQLVKYDEFKDREYTRATWEVMTKGLMEQKMGLITDVNKKIQNEYSSLIDKLSKGYTSNEFVFHFLSNDKLFKTYKDGDELTDKQYARLQGTRSYYNTILKEIQKQAKINLTLSSHVARHTYTQLIINNEADVIAVSKALGHSDLSTTQTYISQLPNTKLLNINDSLSDSFNS